MQWDEMRKNEMKWEKMRKNEKTQPSTILHNTTTDKMQWDKKRKKEKKWEKMRKPDADQTINRIEKVEIIWSTLGPPTTE